jgi:hypothetical protein
VTEFFVSAIETDSVGAQQPLHAGHQVGLRCLDDQVKMVGHEAIGMHLPAGFVASFGQCFEKPMAVIIVRKDVSRRSPRFVTW